jgi:hypothetical protein
MHVGGSLSRKPLCGNEAKGAQTTRDNPRACPSRGAPMLRRCLREFGGDADNYLADVPRVRELAQRGPDVVEFVQGFGKGGDLTTGQHRRQPSELPLQFLRQRTINSAPHTPDPALCHLRHVVAPVE